VPIRTLAIVFMSFMNSFSFVGRRVHNFYVRDSSEFHLLSPTMSKYRVDYSRIEHFFIGHYCDLLAICPAR
jgi:uncharacterized membrane protein YjdF